VPKSGQPRPYDDAEGADGLQRYKLRRDDGGRAENQGLRTAMRRQEPQFVLALTQDQRSVAPGSIVEETLRRYLIAQTKRRLHQPVFASQVMAAYTTIARSFPWRIARYWTRPISSRTRTLRESR
jgi:putative restriction endonuclease